MKRAFEKNEIKSMVLENRIVRSATCESLADEVGRPKRELADMLGALAAGGVGLVITGFAYVRVDGLSAPLQTGIYSDTLIPDLARMAEAVHRAGGQTAMQISHAGAQALVGYNGSKLAAGPSEGRSPVTGARFRELTAGEIATVIEDFGRAAGRSREAGFDAVQIHAAHGYLLSHFLSPSLNRRGDRYGGPLANRARPIYEVYEAVRGAVGTDFPVLIKINGEDFIEDGVALEDSVAVTRNLAGMGLDSVEVTGGTAWSSARLGSVRKKIDLPEKEAYFREQADFFKDKVGIPVMLVGGLRSPRVIEDILSQDSADYASMCRPFIREPELVNRWAGRDDSPAACISCNHCYMTGLEGRGVYCPVREEEEKGDTVT